MTPIAGLPAFDERRLRLDRLARMREQLQRRDLAACVLVDPSTSATRPGRGIELLSHFPYDEALLGREI